MSLVSHVAIYNIYLNNSMDSDTNNKPTFGSWQLMVLFSSVV